MTRWCPHRPQPATRWARQPTPSRASDELRAEAEPAAAGGQEGSASASNEFGRRRNVYQQARRAPGPQALNASVTSGCLLASTARAGVTKAGSSE